MKSVLAFLLFAVAAHAEVASPATVSDLRHEHSSQTTSATPRLSWKISGPDRGTFQSSYRILAASTPEKLAATEGDLWDSGEKNSVKSQLVVFGGDPLKDGQEVHWKVRIKDGKKQRSAWSAPAKFTVSLEKKPSPPQPLFSKDAPRISSFESSDPALDKLFREAAIAIPKITSLRDIQLSVRGASYHQDLSPRAKGWLAHLNHSMGENRFYPATLPADGTYGSTQSDAGLIAAHVLWLMSGDKSLLTDNWTSMNKHVFARKKLDPNFQGRSFGTLPPDSIPKGDPTPPAVIHLASHGLSLRIMTALSRTAAKTPFETPLLQSAYTNLQTSFRELHLDKKHRLKFEGLVGQFVALRYGLLSTPAEKKAVSAQFLKSLDATKDVSPFSHGPLVSADLLPVLTWTDNHDRAFAAAKSQSAADLDPVALANTSEWLIWMVAGIDSGGAGFQQVRLAPYIPKKETLAFAKAHLDTPYGRFTSHWHHEDDGLVYEVSLPGNTEGTVVIPATKNQTLSEGGKPLKVGNGIFKISRQDKFAEVRVFSGSYKFQVGN